METVNYLEPAGSHRNPTWTNLDLMAAYRVPLATRASVSLEARLLNVFDAQTQLSTDFYADVILANAAAISSHAQRVGFLYAPAIGSWRI